MQVLATISDMKRLALVVDLETGKIEAIPVRPEFKDFTIKGRPPCRPFGITWSPDDLFIVNNRQLLVFGHDFHYRKTLRHSLQVNTHQIAFHDGRVWVVSPVTNSLIGVSLAPEGHDIEFRMFAKSVVPYVQREATLEDDVAHFNSLLWANGHLYVAAHAFGPQSFITRYDETTFKLEGLRQDVGASIHNLAMADEELFWLSTGTAEIRTSEGRILPLSREGYARGFAATDDHFVVAISQFLSRNERVGGDSWIQLIHRKSGVVEQELHLKDTGSINDLRLLDVYDYAHRLPPI